MLTPKYLQECTERMQRIAQDFEDDLIALTCAMLILGDVEASIDDITYTYVREGEKEIDRVLADSVRRNVATETALSVEEWQSARMPEATYLRRLLRHVSKITKQTWRNMCHTVAYNAEQEYVKSTDKAYQKVLTGMVSRDKAAAIEVQKLANEGITFVENARREHVDVAIARNLRTAVAQSSGDIILQSAKDRGIKLVLVSAHLGARPTHEVWQGKVYSLEGKTDKYDDFYEATGYGTITGLCGVNCRHTFTAFIEGMKNPFEDVNKEESRKRYAIEQQMRAMERAIRAQKRRVAAAEGTGDADAIKEATTELRRLIREYKAFCAENNMRPLDERLKV